MTFFATLWSLWKERNDITFNNKNSKPEEIEEKIKTRIALWIKNKIYIPGVDVEDIKGNLDGVRRLDIG
jgi:hypothetical protein